MNDPIITESVQYIAHLTLRPSERIEVITLGEPNQFYDSRNDIVETIAADDMIELTGKIHKHLKFDDRNYECVGIAIRQRKTRVTTEVIDE